MPPFEGLHVSIRRGAGRMRKKGERNAISGRKQAERMERVMNTHSRAFSRDDGPRLNFKPQYDKIVELLVYLAHKKPGADQYQAVKMFYLADREHLNRYARPITFDVYYALDYGPVASTTLDIIKGHKGTLKKAGISSLPVRTEQRDKIIVLSEPLRPVDYDIFSKSDLNVFDATLNEYGSKSFDELYKLTHSHFAYDVAWKNRSGNRSLMHYEDMLDEGARKATLVEELEPIAARMK